MTTLAEIIARPDLIDTLPSRARAAIVTEAAALIARLSVSIATAAVEDEPDRVMRDAETAKLLGIGECTLRHKACGSLAHLVVRTGGRRGWSRRKVMEHIRAGGDKVE